MLKKRLQFQSRDDFESCEEDDWVGENDKSQKQRRQKKDRDLPMKFRLNCRKLSIMLGSPIPALNNDFIRYLNTNLFYCATFKLFQTL